MLLVIMVLFISEYVVRQEVVIAEVNNYKEPPAFVKNFKIYFKRWANLRNIRIIW